jgi:GH43 family beta-xylosidase
VGLRGEYSDAFGGQATRVDAALDFDWGANRPVSGVAVDNFRVRWTGLLRPEFSELYTFSTFSDEGVRVWVGDELIIDHWDGHSAATQSGTKLLEAGKLYDLRVEYFDASGAAEIELSWASDSQTGGQLEVISSEHLRAARHTPLLVTNPLGQGQDPWVIRWQDSYLHVRSSGNSVWIDKAAELQDIHSSTPESTTVRAWQAPAGTNYSGQIWAPELHQLDGKWYIYVAASDGNNETHRMHVLERDSPNPMGTYIYKGMIAASTDRWAIDGTVFEWGGKRYFLWSGWPGTTNVQQNLYIAEMSNPWTITGNRVLLSEPTAAWERHGLPINEGPQVLTHDGQLHIIYSGSGYWSQNYALGRLTYDGVGPIMNRSSWTKASGPVFQKTAEIVGVGHASFTKSPDGTQDWIVYHAHPSPGGNADARVIRIQPFTFNANGTPNFGAPIFSNTVEVPSGVPDADGPVLPGDFDASGTVNAQDLAVWKAQFGGEKFPGRAVDGADFLAWQRQLGAVATSVAMESSAAASAIEIAAESSPADLKADRAAAGVAYIAANETAPRHVSMNKAPGEIYSAAATSRPRLYLAAVDLALDEESMAYRRPAVGRGRSSFASDLDDSELRVGFDDAFTSIAARS